MFRLNGFMLVACIALAAVSALAEKKADPLKDAVKEINAALAKNDAAAAKAAFARAEVMKSSHADRKFSPVLKAIGKGVNHKDAGIARAAIDTLGILKIPGSSKALGGFTKPAAKVKPEQVGLYVAALAAAGSIHDPDSLKALDKAVLHPNRDIAEAAGKAFGGYKSLDPKPKLALVKKLIKTLEVLEKKATSARDEKIKESSTAAAAAINESLATLTGKQGASTVKDWNEWVKEQAKSDS